MGSEICGLLSCNIYGSKNKLKKVVGYFVILVNMFKPFFYLPQMKKNYHKIFHTLERLFSRMSISVCDWQNDVEEHNWISLFYVQNFQVK